MYERSSRAVYANLQRDIRRLREIAAPALTLRVVRVILNCSFPHGQLLREGKRLIAQKRENVKSTQNRRKNVPRSQTQREIYESSRGELQWSDRILCPYSDVRALCHKLGVYVRLLKAPWMNLHPRNIGRVIYKLFKGCLSTVTANEFQ